MLAIGELSDAAVISIFLLASRVTIQMDGQLAVNTNATSAPIINAP